MWCWIWTVKQTTNTKWSNTEWKQISHTVKYPLHQDSIQQSHQQSLWPLTDKSLAIVSFQLQINSEDCFTFISNDLFLFSALK